MLKSLQPLKNIIQLATNMACRLPRVPNGTTDLTKQLGHLKICDAGIGIVPSYGIENIVNSLTGGHLKNVVVMVGAGISTPSGIPDFRSPGTGLYDNLKQYAIPYPEAIFELGYLRKNPRPFFTLAKELYPNGKYRPNLVHYFLRLLHEQDVLLRVYTQNIDGLERMAGVPTSKLVEAHGTFLTSSCISCHQVESSDVVRAAIMSDKIPRCSNAACYGIVKPDIVFFGEDLPPKFYNFPQDLARADLLIVMGTSLEVEPFASIANGTRHTVPRLLFNRDVVGPFRPGHRRSYDVVSAGDIVDSVQQFALTLGWADKLQQLIEENECQVGKLPKESVVPASKLHDDHSSANNPTQAANSVNPNGNGNKKANKSLTNTTPSRKFSSNAAKCADNRNGHISRNLHSGTKLTTSDVTTRNHFAETEKQSVCAEGKFDKVEKCDVIIIKKRGSNVLPPCGRPSQMTSRANMRRNFRTQQLHSDAVENPVIPGVEKPGSVSYGKHVMSREPDQTPVQCDRGNLFTIGHQSESFHYRPTKSSDGVCSVPHGRKGSMSTWKTPMPAPLTSQKSADSKSKRVWSYRPKRVPKRGNKITTKLPISKDSESSGDSSDANSSSSGDER